MKCGKTSCAVKLHQMRQCLLIDQNVVVVVLNVVVKCLVYCVICCTKQSICENDINITKSNLFYKLGIVKCSVYLSIDDVKGL